MAKKLSLLKRIIYSFIGVLISIILILIVAEIVLRIFYPQRKADRWYISSEKYGYLMKKDFHQKLRFIDTDFVMDVKTNSIGFRDGEWDLSEKKTPRILLLGDSFVFGYGVNIEDRFDTKLRELINSSGKKYVTYNTGVGGWGTFQETAFARDNFERLKPDIIVLFFCGNDPQDDVKFKLKLSDKGKGLFNFPGKRFLKNNSHLYRFLYIKLHTLMHKIEIKRRLSEDKFKMLRFDKQSSSHISEAEWQNTFSILRNFHKDFIAYNPQGKMLVMATSPNNENIRKHLSTVSNGESIFFVDIYPRSKLLTDEQMRLPFDGHWSVLMHELYAKKLFETIISLE